MAELRIETLLAELTQKKGSDLHLQVGLHPIARIEGELVPLISHGILDADTLEDLIDAMLDEEKQEIFVDKKELDLSFSFGDLGRFRANVFHERNNVAVSLRYIPKLITDLDSLRLPQVLNTFGDFATGLVLVTGPTGSGKSTTLAAVLDKVNNEQSKRIITIEDPLEFIHESKQSVIAQRSIHDDTISFASALRSVVRQDPDIVLVGEMRDLETIAAAITIAETGHLVFGSLHTSSAAQSVDRMIGVFPADQQSQIRHQLSNSLMAVCVQRLIRSIAGGRVPATEVLMVDSATRHMIRESKTHQINSIIQAGVDKGMHTMEYSLADYVKRGVVSYDEAVKAINDSEEFERLIRG